MSPPLLWSCLRAHLRRAAKQVGTSLQGWGSSRRATDSSSCATEGDGGEPGGKGGWGGVLAGMRGAGAPVRPTLPLGTSSLSAPLSTYAGPHAWGHAPGAGGVTAWVTQGQLPPTLGAAGSTAACSRAGAEGSGGGHAGPELPLDLLQLCSGPGAAELRALSAWLEGLEGAWAGFQAAGVEGVAGGGRVVGVKGSEGGWGAGAAPLPAALQLVVGEHAGGALVGRVGAAAGGAPTGLGTEVGMQGAGSGAAGTRGWEGAEGTESCAGTLQQQQQRWRRRRQQGEQLMPQGEQQQQLQEGLLALQGGQQVQVQAVVHGLLQSLRALLGGGAPTSSVASPALGAATEWPGPRALGTAGSAGSMQAAAGGTTWERTRWPRHGAEGGEQEPRVAPVLLHTAQQQQLLLAGGAAPAGAAAAGESELLLQHLSRSYAAHTGRHPPPVRLLHQLLLAGHGCPLAHPWPCTELTAGQVPVPGCAAAPAQLPQDQQHSGLGSRGNTRRAGSGGRSVWRPVHPLQPLDLVRRSLAAEDARACIGLPRHGPQVHPQPALQHRCWSYSAHRRPHPFTPHSPCQRQPRQVAPSPGPRAPGAHAPHGLPQQEGLAAQGHHGIGSGASGFLGGRASAAAAPLLRGPHTHFSPATHTLSPPLPASLARFGVGRTQPRLYGTVFGLRHRRTRSAEVCGAARSGSGHKSQGCRIFCQLTLLMPRL